MASGSMNRRLAALEGSAVFAPLGELLDSLDGEPLPADKSISPAIARALGEMADA